MHRDLAAARRQRVACGSRRGAPALRLPPVIEQVLREAGFREITTVARTVALRLGATTDDAIDHLTDSGPGRAVLETVPAEDHTHALAAVADALRPYHHPNEGVILDAGILLTTGRTKR